MTKDPLVQNKNYATYVGGLFTEATPLNFPDDTVQYTQNFRYDPSGYIERRLGLEESECCASVVDTNDCVVSQSFRWKSVANRRGLDFLVMQRGSKIFLMKETNNDCYEPICNYDLTDLLGSGTQHELEKDLLSFTYGNGSLFITGEHLQPVRFDYVPDNITTVCTDQPVVGCSIEHINIEERDFEGIDDSTSNDLHPLTLTSEHLYNLLNRGWPVEYIYKYFSEVNEFPSKSEYFILGWHVGDSGEEEWSAEEIRKNNTGSSTSSQGHIIRNIFDNCSAGTVSGRPVNINVLDINVDEPNSTMIIKTHIPHGLSGTDSASLVNGNKIINTYYDITDGVGTDDDIVVAHTQEIDIDHIYNPITIISPDEIQIALSELIIHGDTGGLIFHEFNLVFEFGQIVLDTVIPDDIPCCVDSLRPRVNNFFSGRLWHMSLDSDRIGTNVYFSQIIKNHEDEGQAYQDQDPTAKDYNELSKSDGGSISIPEMGRILGAHNLKDSMLMFAENGVWKISGSLNSSFNATEYNVSKLTDVGCISSKSICDIEDTIVYASSQGLYIVSSDSRVQSITEKAIHTKYYNIGAKDQIEINYHKYDKTLHVLYPCDVGACSVGDGYDSELVYNIRSNTWYEYNYSKKAIISAFPTRNNSVRGRGLNYIVKEDDLVKCYFMSDCNYKDFTSQDSATAYLHTAPETLGDLIYEKRIDRQVFYFDNIVDSKALVNHVWDFGNVDEECNTKGKEITFNSPCLTVASDRTLLDGDTIGTSVSLEIASIDSNPLKLYGWATKFVAMGVYEAGRKKNVNVRRDARYKT